MINLSTTVFIPGLNCNERLYESQIAALKDKTNIIVANHTKSSNMQDLAKYIILDLPEKFNLIGLSMGGYIAFEILRQVPQRINKLVLMDTSAREDTPEQTERRKKAIEFSERGKFMMIADDLWPKLVDKSRLEDDELYNIVMKMAEETGAEAFINQQKAIISRPDSRGFLKEIKNQTLVIVGENDQLTPPEIAKEITDGIANSKLEIIENCGHLSSLEKPYKVNLLLQEFLL